MSQHDDQNSNSDVSRETKASVSSVSKSLGRGLDSLLGPKSSDLTSEKKQGLSMLPLTVLSPSRYQPRTVFDDQEMKDLAASIEENGVLQPILVRPTDETDAFGSPKYEIIAGERRWRASKLAGRKAIPVVIRHLSDKQALESGLIENIQRDDLDAIEEATGYQRLIDEFSYTQEQISKIIGKSRSHIANTLRLLSLPKSIQDHIEANELTPGHVRPLIGHDKAEQFADLFIKQGLNVRQAETLISKYAEQPFDLDSFSDVLEDAERDKKAKKGQSKRNSSPSGSTKPDDILALESELKSALGLVSTIKMKDDQSGSVQIHFKSPAELDRLMNLIFGAL